jgi:hypothetical protein
MGAMAIVTHAPESIENLLELPKVGVLTFPIGDNNT